MNVQGPVYTILKVKDLAAARGYYTDKLGFSATENTTDSFVELKGPGEAMLALMPTDGPSGASAEMYFATDDVDRVYREWQAKGVSLRSEPTDMPFGRTFSFTDPDGHNLWVLKP